MGITIKNIKISPEAYVRQYIQPVAVQRQKQGIDRWRLAIKSAETATNPQRYLMQEIFLDTVLNGHVKACIEKRYSNVLKKGIQVVNEKGEVNDTLTALYSKKWMYQIIRYILDAKMYGYSLIQLGNMVDYDFDEVYTIRRANVNPELEIITSAFYDVSGISINDPQFSDNLLWVKTPQDIGMAHNWGHCGYGLLYTIAPYEIWYKQALTLWAEYQQLFGVPIRIGKTDTRNEQMRLQMAAMLENMGSKAWGVFDTKDSIELVAPQNVNGLLIFDAMIMRQEKIISKVILGHADAIDSIPSKLGNSGQESPADKAMENIETFDCQDVEFELEKNIVPKLVNLGFKMPDGHKIVFNNSHEKIESRIKEDINNKATADMVKVFSDSGYKVDATWITERTGIPLEEKEEPAIEPIKKQGKVANELKNKLKELYGKAECGHTH